VRLEYARSALGFSRCGLGGLDGGRVLAALILYLVTLVRCSRQAMDGDLFSHTEVREQGRPRHG